MIKEIANLFRIIVPSRGGSPDNSSNWVSVSDGIRQAFHDDGTDSLGFYVAIGRGVEGVAEA